MLPKSTEVDITTDHIIEILEQSLYEPYSINPAKFNVHKLIKSDRKVDSLLIQELESKIQTKVNTQKRQINKIFIDFGPYPLSKNWQVKKKERTDDMPADLNPSEKKRKR